ncbi:TetR/AcrR family transcriptional regulator C-terminal domain-containing protein [Gordonia sinesedis]
MDDIASQAIALADARGIDAVTMRRLAAELGTGTTSLYRVIDGRDALVEAMVDGALAQFAPAPPTGRWRTDLAAFAHAGREVLLAHPWLGAVMSARPAFGPHAMRRLETGLAAATTAVEQVAGTRGTSTDGDVVLGRVLEILDVVNAYVLGAVTREIAERGVDSAGEDPPAAKSASADPAVDSAVIDAGAAPKERWQRRSGPRVRELLAGGGLPHVERMVRGDPDAMSPDTRFARGLQVVLDGVQAAGES